ncbi:MAG: hypothetical protein NXI18_20525 [Alphaproteobacteria bacterium]|nr:hypothetical protein [Alphaproteobacteria bacterium]
MIHRAPFYTKLRPFCGLDIYFKREEVLEGMEDHVHEPELAYGYVVKHGCPVNPIFYKKDPNPVFSQMKDYHVPLDQKETGDHLFLDITIPFWSYVYDWFFASFFVFQREYFYGNHFNLGPYLLYYKHYEYKFWPELWPNYGLVTRQVPFYLIMNLRILKNFDNFLKKVSWLTVKPTRRKTYINYNLISNSIVV